MAKPTAADVIKYLDIDPDKFETEEALKEAINAAWTKLDVAHDNPQIHSRVMGKANAVIMNRIKALSKTHELAMEPRDWDSLSVADAIDKFNELTSGKYTARLSELEEAAKGKGGGKAVEEAERKILELSKKAEAFELSAKDWQGKYTELEAGTKKREVEAKKSAEWERASASVKWKQGVEPFTMKGFLSEKQREYQVLFDDEGAPYAADINGKRVPNPDKAATFLTLSEIMENEAAKHKLTETNPHGGAPVVRNQPPPNQNPVNNGTVRERPINPMA
jgi:hypothetical protein